ncbi:MAG TPA: DUF4293 domain-containing protein [Mucilaginibacter sp.]
MIQRIQSIYLLLASLALFALFLFPLAHNVYVDGKPLTIMVTGVYQDVNGQNTQTRSFLGITIATAVLALVPLVIIFLYKNRKQQMTFGYLTLVLIVAYSFWLSQMAKGVMGSVQIDTHNWGIGLFLSSISMLLILLAIRAIKGDEKLVKSADRLR